MLDHALYLLECGLSVIPLVRKTKLPPAGCTWKEQQLILPTEQTVIDRFTQHKNCNLGVITGPASGVVVIDGDSQKACHWIEQNFPRTWLTVTTNRGCHYYYKYPRLNENQKIKTTSNIVHQDVDVRGYAGLVVVPPSVHISGKKYEWNIATFSLDELDELPACPLTIPGLLDTVSNYHSDENKRYCNGSIQNIENECMWIKYCKENNKELKYNELMHCISIIARCENGVEIAHKFLSIHFNNHYNSIKCDKKINKILNNMSAVTCSTVAEYFQACKTCRHFIKNFSPIILSNNQPIILSNVIEDIENNINEKNESIIIPEHILDPGGLISEGMAAVKNTDCPRIDQYIFPVIISLIARAICGKVAYGTIWPNFYHIKVGGTSTGKTDIDIRMKHELQNYDLNDFYGPDDFSSGPGLLRGLAEQPQCIVNLDEISYIFKRYDRPDPIIEGKISILLDLFKKCGLSYIKPYGDKNKNIIVEKPCLIIVGNATPTIFECIKEEDFNTGFMQRITFWYYSGPILYRKPFIHHKNDEMKLFINKLAKIFHYHYSSDLVNCINKTIQIGIDDAALKKLDEYGREVTDKGNEQEDDWRRGMVSRRYDEAIKYALINYANFEFNPHNKLSIDNINYGINVAEMLADWKLNVLYKKVKAGNFHNLCSMFKDGIRAAMRINKIPTLKIIFNRKKILKNLRPRELDDIIKALKDRDEIIIDDKNGLPKFYLKKNSELYDILS